MAPRVDSAARGWEHPHRHAGIPLPTRTSRRSGNLAVRIRNGSRLHTAAGFPERIETDGNTQ